MNKALEAAGHPERICRGKGYWYFIEGEAHTWLSSSVCVFHLNDYTAEQWVEQRNWLAEKRYAEFK